MRKDKGHYKDKYPADRKVDQRVAEAVKKRTEKGEITCAIAFNVAEAMNVSPGEIGFTMDRLEIPIRKCQLGLFGYSPISRIIQKAETVPNELEEAIRGAMIDGRLSCEALWKIAKEFRIAKIRVSAACEKLGIKISQCQLGAF
jgi:DNA invertase Pin-like site-specific DNA recombinase